jgi:hypothetical protein
MTETCLRTYVIKKIRYLHTPDDCMLLVVNNDWQSQRWTSTSHYHPNCFNISWQVLTHQTDRSHSPTFQTLCSPHSCQSSSVFHYMRLNIFKFYGISLSWNNICPKNVVILLNTDSPAFVLLEVTLYVYYWYLTNSWNLKRVLQWKWIPTLTMDSVSPTNHKHACISLILTRPSLGTLL